MCENVGTGLLNQAARGIRLEPTAQAPGEARRFVAQALTELGHSYLIEDARLIASELVTNSRAAAPDWPIWVGIWQTGAFVDLEVWDHSPEPPVCLDPDVFADGGRGLHIVKQLATCFGYATFRGGKAVWVLLDLINEREMEMTDRGISWV